MSYFLTFAADDKDGIEDSDQIATTRGWHDFGTWAERLPREYDAIAFLVAEGGLATKEDIADLEAQLTRALVAKPNGPSAGVLSVARRLLEELRNRPRWADAFAVNDGTPAGAEGEG
jgi:hypothetical protein